MTDEERREMIREIREEMDEAEKRAEAHYFELREKMRREQNWDVQERHWEAQRELWKIQNKNYDRQFYYWWAVVALAFGALILNFFKP